MYSTLHYSGFLLPVVEIFLGLGLYFSKNKKAFVWLTLLMHIFLLLYSGNAKKMAICIKNTDKNPELQPFVLTTNSSYCDGQQTINATKWIFTELNVPIYAEDLYYKKLKMAWNKKFPETESRFVVFYYPFKPEAAKEIK